MGRISSYGWRRGDLPRRKPYNKKTKQSGPLIYGAGLRVYNIRIARKETKKIRVILADPDFRLFSAEGRCP